MGGDLVSTMEGLVTGPLDALRNKIEGHSPSMVMFRIGVDIGQGLINGIESMIPNVLSTMSDLGNAVSGAAVKLGLNANEVKTGEGQISDRQFGENVLYRMFGGLFGGGADLPKLTVPTLTVPPMVAAVTAPLVAALTAPAGLTGVGSGGGGGAGASGRVPLGALGAQFMQVAATGGSLHSGTSPQERLQQRQVDQGQKQIDQGSNQVTLLQEMRDFMQSTNRGINRIADMVIRGATPQTPPINTAQALGVARPVG
jgi:hypothetical protein